MIELAGMLVLGFLAQWLAWRIKVPAILPLILIGLFVGPLSTFLTADGSKFVDGDKIFHGELLFDVISLSVGLILFEGGLTLKLDEVKTLGKAVRNLILSGTIVTLFGGAIATHYIFDINYRTSFLFGALIIVTGPTVIGPILRNVRPNFNINTVLKWEGILIDPVGALIAILTYEFIVSGKPNEQIGFFALKGFIITVFVGTVIGVGFALLVYQIFQKKLVPKYLRNIVVLALVIMSFALADVIHAESGLLAVTLMGMVIANLKIEGFKQILHFKEDVVQILISFLFILLSSRIDIRHIMLLANYQSLLLFIVVVYLLRPLAVFISSYKTGLTLKETLFISYICPRGIVSAGVASIFTIRLVDLPVRGLDFSSMADDNMLLLPLTFMMIVGTVIIQGITAKPVAKALGVLQGEPIGVLFLGANEPARFLAKHLKMHGTPILLADTSHANINEARAMGLPVFEGSLMSDDIYEQIDLSQYGQLYAMTSNTEINIMTSKLFSGDLADMRVYRLASNRETEMQDDLQKPQNLLVGGSTDFIGLTQAVRDNPFVKELDVDSAEEVHLFLKNQGDKVIPLLLLKKGHKAEPITDNLTDVEDDEVMLYIAQI